MKYRSFLSLAFSALSACAIAQSAASQSTAASVTDPVEDSFFCGNIHRLSPEGYWQAVEGSFSIGVSDTSGGTVSERALRTYRYASVSEEFGDLTLEGGQIASTGFSWVYTFLSDDKTLYELEDMWDGDMFLKVFDPYGTNVLDATCASTSAEGQED